MLSEKFWKDAFCLKFNQYYVENKNHPMRGGVAILIHKSIQFTVVQLPDRQTIEALGVLIVTEKEERKEMLDLLTVYIPNGHHFDVFFITYSKP